VQILSEKEEKDKLVEKLQNAEKRLKKFNDIVNENKRKQKIITDKVKEV
jgi:hypothetical protein